MGRMGAFFANWIAPESPVSDSEDPIEVKKRYDYWRVRTFYSMFFGYAFYYFTRKSFTFAMPALISEMGYSKAELGFLASTLSLTYGISKFVSGVVSDRSNPRYIMAAGIIATGFCNILFGISSSLVWFAIFWGLNGWFQGFGWPPCARYLTHWYSQRERGRWWAAWNTSHNIGGALIPVLVTFCASLWGWRVAMYVPGIFAIGMGFFLLNRLRDTPQSLGLPPIEKYRNDYPSKTVKDEINQPKPSVKEILFVYVLSNPFVWILAFANFFLYTVRIGVNDWSALFLVEYKNYNQVAAGFCVSWFEVGGFIGSLTAGWLSDRVFRGRRGPVNALFSVGIICSILFLFLVPPGHRILDSFAMLTVGFTVFGPQMLIGVAAAEVVQKKAAATSSGFSGFFGYIGAAAAGLPLGMVAQAYGWIGFFTALASCGLVTAFLLVFFWSLNSRSRSSIKDSGRSVAGAVL